MSRIFLIAALLFTSIFTYAQNDLPAESTESTQDESIEIIPEDKADFKMGFSFGINRPIVETKGPEVEFVDEKYGFDLGIIADIGVNDWLRVSPRASLSFYEATVAYVNPDNDHFEKYGVSSVGINTSSYIVIKRPTIDNAPYVYMGPTFRINTKKELETNEFSTSQLNWSLDLGIGFDKDFKFFFLSPEIRYSYGLNNANLNPQFENLKMHSLSVIFNFKE